MAKKKCPMDKSKRKKLKNKDVGIRAECRKAGCAVVASTGSYSDKKYDVLPGGCLFG